MVKDYKKVEIQRKVNQTGLVNSLIETHKIITDKEQLHMNDFFNLATT